MGLLTSVYMGFLERECISGGSVLYLTGVSVNIRGVSSENVSVGLFYTLLVSL